MNTEKFNREELDILRAIRRAAMGARACSQVLQHALANEPIVPATPGVFIALNADQLVCLTYAVEACAVRITDIFDNEMDEVGFEDPICPETDEAATQLRAIG